MKSKKRNVGWVWALTKDPLHLLRKNAKKMNEYLKILNK